MREIGGVLLAGLLLLGIYLISLPQPGIELQVHAPTGMWNQPTIPVSVSAKNARSFTVRVNERIVGTGSKKWSGQLATVDGTMIIEVNAVQYNLWGQVSDTQITRVMLWVDTSAPEMGELNAAAIDSGMLICGYAQDAHSNVTQVAAAGVRTVPDATGQFCLTVPWDRALLYSTIGVKAMDGAANVSASYSVPVVRPGSYAIRYNGNGYPVEATADPSGFRTDWLSVWFLGHRVVVVEDGVQSVHQRAFSPYLAISVAVGAILLAVGGWRFKVWLETRKASDEIDKQIQVEVRQTALLTARVNRTKAQIAYNQIAGLLGVAQAESQTIHSELRMALEMAHPWERPTIARFIRVNQPFESRQDLLLAAGQVDDQTAKILAALFARVEAAKTQNMEVYYG